MNVLRSVLALGCMLGFLVLTLGACEEDSNAAPRSGRGLGTPAGPVAPSSAPPKRSVTTPRLAPLRGAPSISAKAATPGPGLSEASNPSARPRDFAAELRANLGDPSPCFNTVDRPEGDPTIEFVVTARVVESGRVTRAEVVGDRLSRTENACVRGLAESASVRGPVPDAPRSIATPVVLRWSEPDDA